MNVEQMVDALLRVHPITSVVQDNVALDQLPQGAGYPAVVYRAVSTIAVPGLCGPAQTYTSRVQVNPLAGSMGQVMTLQALARAAIEGFAVRTVAGRRLISARFEGLGPASKDEFTGVWTQPADYILMHE